MPLPLTVTDLTQVPEAIRPVYKQRTDGAGFILDVEGGAVAKATLDEFRNTNIALQKKLALVQDVDPDEVATLRATNAQLRADAEKTHKGLAAEADARVKAVTAKAESYRQQLQGVLIDREVARAAAALGAHPGAIDDVATRIRSRFKLGDDGKPVAVDAAGHTIYGEDGQALSVEGAVRQLTTQAPHLFRPQVGSGAAHTSGGAGRHTTQGGNPFIKGPAFSVTEQARLMKHNRPEAERLAAEAGVKLP